MLTHKTGQGALLLAALLLAGCSPGVSTEVEVTIILVTDRDNSSWGCIATNVRTVVETEDGYRARLCGEWGREGDTLRGTWTVGHWDAKRNGFRPY